MLMMLVAGLKGPVLGVKLKNKKVFQLMLMMPAGSFAKSVQWLG